MKKFLLILFLSLNGFIFSQDRDASFPGGIDHLKNIIISKINLDSLGNNYENSIVKLFFTIKKNGKVKEISCNYDDEKTKAEFLRASQTINKKWHPAIKNGKKINSTVIISFPIVFE